MAKLYQKIDKLTNSIVHKLSGKSYDTEVVFLQKSDLKLLIMAWKFNWKDEFKKGEVYKLVIKGLPSGIQGLMTLIDKKEHIFMSLIEIAPHNYGHNKVYEGVLGNLVAFACQLSFKKGYDGFVSFVPKTKLIDHYAKVLGAKLMKNGSMFIETDAAKYLVDKYYKK
jgi:hypothetical protein